MYVLHIERGDATRISSVAEFLLVQPCLGLAVEDVVAERKPLMADHLPELLNGWIIYINVYLEKYDLI